jgi:hypothetical protein
MKKTALLTAFVCFSLLTAHAQLANTKWTGMVRIPTDSTGTLRPYGVTWIFTSDTASMIYDIPEMGTEVMTYKTAKDKIMFKKVSGGVPCDTIAVLACSYAIKNDQLSLSRISDQCKPRGQADASQPFTRVK